MTAQLSITEANQARCDLIKSREGIAPLNTELEDRVYHTINGYVPENTRHLTVDELPKVRIDKRNGYPDWYKKPSTRKPRKIAIKTRAKRAAALVNSFQFGQARNSVKREWVDIVNDDYITHVATGRVWDASTGATPEEFMDVLS